MDDDLAVAAQVLNAVLDTALALLHADDDGQAVALQEADALRPGVVRPDGVLGDARDALFQERRCVVQLQARFAALVFDPQAFVVNPAAHRSGRVLGKAEIQPVIRAVPLLARGEFLDLPFAGEDLAVGARDAGALPDVGVIVRVAAQVVLALFLQLRREPGIVVVVEPDDPTVRRRIQDKPLVGRAVLVLRVPGEPDFRARSSDGRNQILPALLGNRLSLFYPANIHAAGGFDLLVVEPQALEQILRAVSAPDVALADLVMLSQPRIAANGCRHLGVHRVFQAVLQLPGAQDAQRLGVATNGRHQREAERLT